MNLPGNKSSITELENRTIKEAELYVMDPDITMLAVAKFFKLSQTCIHHDFHTRLKDLNLELYKKVLEKIKLVNKLKTIKGGESARVYFANRRQILISMKNKK